jgi:hypothetical protein
MSPAFILLTAIVTASFAFLVVVFVRGWRKP